jgi:phospholipase/carboxylesterase
VSVQSPDPSDLGQGWQWFSVRGVTTDNRAARVATAMPRFVQTVARWQHQSGVEAPGTTLLGFSQGAIMALESTQEPQPLAGRVVAMAGRFGAPPQRAIGHARIHLLHGQADGVVPAQASIEAQAQLAALQADVTLDLFPGLGHGIDARMSARLWERLAAAE